MNAAALQPRVGPRDLQEHNMADEPFELTASRIASLIGVAQSAETVVEVLAGMLLGERSRE